MLRQRFTDGRLEAGVDEAGRGCLAGPVFAAAVILPDGFRHPLLADSKQMSAANRERLRPLIEKHALAWAVGVCDHEEIDAINILNASILAMHRALDKLRIPPQFILVDGNRFKPYPGTAHRCFVKGDSLFAPIAAASVLAKTHRDQFITGLHHRFPQYGWDRNKAYATRAHREAVLLYGRSPYHRRSFAIRVKDQPAS